MLQYHHQVTKTPKGRLGRVWALRAEGQTRTVPVFREGIPDKPLLLQVLWCLGVSVVKTPG